MTAIFISHSSADNDAALDMKAWLEQQGHTSLFLDFDPEAGIRAGSDWEKTLYYKLRQCQAVVALLTPSWLASKWCFAELVQAREKGKAIFPVKVRPCDTGGVFGDVQHIDLTEKSEEGYRRLAIGLRERGLDPLDVFDWDSKRSPYPGLLAFQEEDAAIFFGRGEEILYGLETLDALRRRGRGAPRLVLFLGASGSGKSSLVRAGLIPRLKKTPSEWLPLTPFRPQDDPLDELALALGDGFEALGRPQDWGAIARKLKAAAGQEPADGQVLLALVRELAITAKRREATVVLTVDQAEELFGYSSAETASRFWRLLRAALEASDRQLIAVATLRSDFLGEFQTVRALHDPAYDHDFAYQAVPVDPMPERNFVEIIRGPARLAGLRLEDGLVEAMVGDTGTRDALPLLAFTLRRLYDRCSADGLLEIREYDTLGRLEGAIRAEAERVLMEARTSPEDLEALRAAFVPSLVRINAEGGYARRRAHAEEMPPRARSLLRRFIDARLLISDRDQDGQETVEVAHEALLRAWPQLSGWLAEDQDRLRLRESIHRAAEEWDGGGRPADLIVHRDGRLKDAEALITNRRFAVRENSLEQHYLDACIEAQHAREAAEREEQERRVRDAERIAEEQKKAAAAQKKTVQRTRVGLVVAVLLAAAVGLFAWVADQNSRAAVAEAEKARAAERKALSRQLAAQANAALLNNEIDRSLLLSVEAYRTHDDYDTRDSLLTALEHSPHLAAFLRGHNPATGRIGVYSVAFGPDGEMLASGGRDGRVILWDVAQRKPARIPLATHFNNIGSVAIDPAGKIVASAGFDGLWLWDIRTGAQIAQPEGVLGRVSDSPLFNIEPSPDRKTLAYRGPDGRPIVLDLVAGKHIDQGVLGVEFSLDGKTLVFGGSDNRLKLWDVVAGKQIRQLKTWVNDVAVSPDGNLVASGSCGKFDPGTETCLQGEIRVWDLVTGQPIGRPLVAHADMVTSLAFSPLDGELLASGGADNTVRLWSVANGEQIGEPFTGHTERVNSVAFHPNGRILASGSSDTTLRLWDVERRARIGQPLRGHKADVFSVAFSPSGKILASSGYDNTIILWNVATEGAISTSFAERSASGRMSVAFSPDGRFLASGGSDATITMWNVETGEAVGQWLVADPAPKITGITGEFINLSHRFVSGLAFNPADGGTLASGTPDGTIAFWEVPTGQPVGQPLHHPGEVRMVVFSPDGMLLATSGSGKIVLWDVAERIQIGQPWDKHMGDVYSIAFSPDGKIVASGSLDNTVILWDVASGGPIDEPLIGHGTGVRSVAFSPNEPILASADTGGTIILWNTETREIIGQLSSGQGSGTSVAFSADGKMLASGSRASDGTLILWDVATGKPIGHPLVDPYTTHQINDVAFSPKDQLVATALENGNVLLWNASLDSWQDLACRIANRNLTAAEWEQISEDPYRKTCPDLPVHPSVYQPALEQFVKDGSDSMKNID